MDEQTYEIQDGVRRAKAAWLCGQQTLLAQVEGSNEINSISLSCLRSLKIIIEDYGSRGADWGLNGLVASFDENMKRGESVPKQARELAAANV